MTSLTFSASVAAARQLLPVSAADELIRYMSLRGFMSLSMVDQAVEDPHSPAPASAVKVPAAAEGMNFNFTSENMRQTFARFICLLALPCIVKVGVYYNLAAGGAHFILGCISHIKHPEGQDGEYRAHRMQTAEEFKLACIHVTTAVYDFALQYLVSITSFLILIGFAISCFPKHAIDWHHRVFDKETIDQGNSRLSSRCLIEKYSTDFAQWLVPIPQL